MSGARAKVAPLTIRTRNEAGVDKPQAASTVREGIW
jgi:hypothetical protein